ncbi:MAG: hypothetical protein NW217_04230 [Hyphomicrobiaceae bacterium]|nr:hypothetical protein [Hyphomicrobiaceae bacterium]
MSLATSKAAGRVPLPLLSAAGALVLQITAAAAGPAIGQFELKDLESEPGRVEFQSQNAHAFGQPHRRMDTRPGAGGETAYDDHSVVQQRHALELEFSVTRYFRMRVGVEYEKERLDDPASPALANDFGELQLDEVALEGVVIVVPVPETGGVGFGMLAEFEAPVGGDDLNSIVFGPILELRAGAWSAIANLTLVKAFGNGGFDDDGTRERDRKLDLAYAIQVSHALDETWAVALEAYGTIDRLGHSGDATDSARRFGDRDIHRAGPLIYYTRQLDRPAATAGEAPTRSAAPAEDGTVLTIGTGVLVGLNQHTPDATLKWSVEVEF